MEDGQLYSNKVIFIIQARMSSTRLPGKILMPIPLVTGKTLLNWIVDELKKSKFNKSIFIATSENKENDSINSFCELNDISCFRGDEDNVLSRFISIVEHNESDCVIRLTADNPIVDIKILDELIKFHLEKSNDYSKTEGMPLGMNLEAINPNLFLSLKNNTELSKDDKEHVTLFFKTNNSFLVNRFFPLKTDIYKELRLTVDYSSDYALLAIMLSVAEFKNLRGINLVDYMLENHSWVFSINENNIQKRKLHKNDELIYASSLMEKYGLLHAQELLKQQIL